MPIIAHYATRISALQSLCYYWFSLRQILSHWWLLIPSHLLSLLPILLLPLLLRAPINNIILRPSQHPLRKLAHNLICNPQRPRNPNHDQHK